MSSPDSGDEIPVDYLFSRDTVARQTLYSLLPVHGGSSSSHNSNQISSRQYHPVNSSDKTADETALSEYAKYSIQTMRLDALSNMIVDDSSNGLNTVSSGEGKKRVSFWDDPSLNHGSHIQDQSAYTGDISDRVHATSVCAKVSCIEIFVISLCILAALGILGGLIAFCIAVFR